MNLKDFREKFEIDNLAIKEYSHWTVSVRPKQVTLSSLIISLNRTCESLSELNDDETRELSLVFKEIEKIMCKWVSFEKINYLALMMVDDFVHFHVIPRYNGSRSFELKSFHDHNWPKHPLNLDDGVTDPIILKKIKEKIISELTILTQEQEG